MATRAAAPTMRKRSAQYLQEALYNRLFRDGSSNPAVRNSVGRFLASGKRVYGWEVAIALRRLRGRGRFGPALRLSETLAKRGMDMKANDQAIHLDLVSKAKGIASAEDFFVSLPEPSKNHLTYGALLHCYCMESMTDKAEALMEKMKELKFASSALPYNNLMNLYRRTNSPERVPVIIQEMKANDVAPDCLTYNAWMKALAAMKDIAGVERVMEEMRSDDRVHPDWTTFSSLAFIYVDAGEFLKAEVALKRLEKKKAGNFLKSYQFLITLYGRIGNLKEVYRIWRSLKLSMPKMATISYLNMIQALINLKDLSGAEACFKEWESKCNTYDIRVVNALLRAYIMEDQFEKAEALRHSSKKKGAILNATTWETFMQYYLNKGEMKGAYWCADRAIKKGKSQGRVWVPTNEVIQALMAYFEESRDVASAEKFILLLKSVEKELDAEVFESLVRTYANTGKSCPGMRQRLKMENVVVSEATERLLDSVSSE